MTRISVNDDGVWMLAAPEPFQPRLAELLHHGGARADLLIIGLDMPLGLPEPYAKRVGISDFRRFLTGDEGPGWADFSRVSTHLATVSLERPFFPKGNIAEQDKSGGKPQLNWLRQLGMEKAETYRRCDLG
ncbi:MAG: hypothetical protein AAF556_05295, partial [Pseudomonadota bacterium]